MIRPSTGTDLPAITAIYEHHVLHGTGTFEVDPPSVADMTGRRADVLSKGLPWLVATLTDEASKTPRVVGFAYCNWFKPRPAYRFSAEDSIYLSPEVSGKGYGSLLLTELMAQAPSVCTVRPVFRTWVCLNRAGGSSTNGWMW